MKIARAASRPVVLCDTQDNPGCGSTADTTGVLETLVRLGAEGAAVGYLCDAEAAAAAHEAGAGADIELALGGRSGPASVMPFPGTFRVTRLGSGKMRTTGKVSGGRDIDLGPMALLTIGGVGVAVTSKRMQALDQAPFLHLRVEPSQQKILALKSTCHFRAEFEPIAEKVIVVIAPGGYLADPARLSLPTPAPRHPPAPARPRLQGNFQTLTITLPITVPLSTNSCAMAISARGRILGVGWTSRPSAPSA